MIRNRSLKAFGVALAAALALSAALAPAALAVPKLTSFLNAYPATLEGASITSTVIDLGGTRPIECTKKFEGTINNKAEAEKSEVTITPTLENCTASILGNRDPATVTFNGCKYRLRFTEETRGVIEAEGWQVTGKENEIMCPAGKEIEIHAYATKEKDEKNEPLCTYKIGPQVTGGDIDYKMDEALPSKTLTMNTTLEGIAVTKTTGTVTNCGAVAQNATSSGETKVAIRAGGIPWSMEGDLP